MSVSHDTEVKMKTKKPLLLVVDDIPTTLELLVSLFDKQFAVVPKQNGKEALEWLHEGHLPDLIISDIRMPVMDGYEFMTQVKSSGLFRDIPFFVLSAVHESQERVKFLQEGAEDFLTKPFNPDELLIRVDKIIRRNSRV